MFYEIEIRTHVRVPPSDFGRNTKEAVLERLNEQFTNFISKDLGVIIGVTGVSEIGDGILIPGDGGAYHDTQAKIIAFKPELQEVIHGEVTEIADFGAFINMGPLDGMIHISQTMDDFVSFSKSGVLTGKETKRTLKTGDKCRARVVAISYKDMANPKIALTMRQPALGSLVWIAEDLKKQKKTVKEEKEKPKK